MSKLSTIAEMDLVGDAPCLDFVNSSLNNHLTVERLNSYLDLLLLARRLNLLDGKTLDKLGRIAVKQPADAERVLLKAREVRLSMRHIFSGLAAERVDKISVAQLKIFNDNVVEALAERKFEVSGNKLKTGWSYPAGKLKQLVWIFSLSAYQLLNMEDQQMIKQCGACAWLFLDKSKNHRRKWCDMKTCGTNEKARRYYQRTKKV